MAEHQKAGREKTNELDEEHRRKKAPSLPLDQLKQAGEAVDSLGFLAGLSFQEQASFLGDPTILEPQKAQAILDLQSTYGNRYVQKLVELETVSSPVTAAPVPLAPASTVVPAAFEGKGKTATGALQQTNESGMEDPVPRAFVNGGKTGSAVVHWAGGGGGLGNQPFGDVAEVVPAIETRDPAGEGQPAKAWVRPGTGTARVTRSYVGVLVGANGASYYITASGAARIDRHEGVHVSNSRGHHDTYIVPLEARVAQHRGEANALTAAATAQARANLESFLNWANTITSFRTSDTTDNRRGGTVDTTDSASADYYYDYGPQTVGGVNYAHYIDTRPGPARAPATP